MCSALCKKGLANTFVCKEFSAEVGLLSSRNCPCAFGCLTRDLDMVVHGDDVIVAGRGGDVDCVSQHLNENLEVQQATLGLGYTTAKQLNRCDVQ